MRLSELIGRLDSAELRELVSRVVPGASEIDANVSAHKLELVLVNTGHVEEAIIARRPPVASVLLHLLESEGHVLDLGHSRATIEAEVDSWCSRVTAGELAHRVADRSNIYRRMLEAAWRNDLVLDPSELRMLGLLREELGLLRMDHFLLAHHSSIEPFWRREGYVDLLLSELEHHGVLFHVEPDVWVLPEELVAHVRRALGVRASRDATRRLLGQLDSQSHLRSALADHDLATSGSKSERIERLVENFIPVERVVDTMHIFDARDLARRCELPVSGAKEELVGRIVDFFAMGGDQRSTTDAVDDVVTEAEERVLSQSAFSSLFTALKGYELQRLLMALGLRHSGSKETRVAALWGSPYSERTLLGKLKSPELNALLQGFDQTVRGSKGERVERLLAFLSSGGEAKEGSEDSPVPSLDGPAGAARGGPDGGETGLIQRLATLLDDVEVSSTSPNRFDAVRAELAVTFELSPETVGVKYLGDPKNHRNRIGEAMRSLPRLLVLLVPRDEGDAAIEAARSRLEVSPSTVCVALLQDPDDLGWSGGDLLAARETPLLEAVAREWRDAEVHLVGLPEEAEQGELREFVGRLRVELSSQWTRDDVPAETRVRRALVQTLKRADSVIRTKHVSDAKNVGNRISEAVGAGCDAIVLFVSAELGDISRRELEKQLGSSRRTLVGVVIAEREDGDYSEPAIVHRELEPEQAEGP